MDNRIRTGQNCWAFTDVVLDTMFSLLDPSDLKNVRLTCRKWAAEGYRHLARKTFIRLSQVTIAAANSNGRLLLPHFVDHFNFCNFICQHGFRQLNAGNCSDDPVSEEFHNPHWSDIWESSGELEPREYFTIGAYRSYLDSLYLLSLLGVIFPSAFKPRNVIVYLCVDFVKLPMPHFRYLEKLELVFVTATQVYDLLKMAVAFLPNLKELKLGNIVRNCYNDALDNESGLDICDTKQLACLEELSFYVPADLLHLDWSFLVQFSKLKKLQILWPGSICSEGSNFIPSPCWTMAQSYEDSNNFGNWLQATNPYFNWSCLKTLSLRFDLMSTNVQSFQSTLAAAVSLESLSLEVYGPFENLRKLIGELGRKNVALLKDLNYCSDNMLLQSNSEDAIEILKMLNNGGFFLKPIWTVSFRGFDDCCCYMKKKLTHFAFQKSNYARHLTDVIQTLWQHFPAIFANYNYAFMTNTDEDQVTRNLSEAFDSEAFLDSDFLSFNLLPGTERAAKRIRQKPFDKLLCCDSPWFYQEAGLCLGRHSKEASMRTFTFTHVPQSLLTKFLLLQSINS